MPIEKKFSPMLNVLTTKYYVVVSKINHQFYIFERKLTIRGFKCFYFVLEIANNAIEFTPARTLFISGLKSRVLKLPLFTLK